MPQYTRQDDVNYKCVMMWRVLTFLFHKGNLKYCFEKLKAIFIFSSIQHLIYKIKSSKVLELSYN